MKKKLLLCLSLSSLPVLCSDSKNAIKELNKTLADLGLPVRVSDDSKEIYYPKPKRPKYTPESNHKKKGNWYYYGLPAHAVTYKSNPHYMKKHQIDKAKETCPVITTKIKAGSTTHLAPVREVESERAEVIINIDGNDTNKENETLSPTLMEAILHIFGYG